MRTIDRPVCPVCAQTGDVLYDQLQDRLFGAPGTWRMKRCRDRMGCGTLWLDPAPHPDDLFEAYQHYYTHASEPEAYTRLLDVPGHQVWAALLLGYPMPQGWRSRVSALRMLLRPKEIERALFFRLYLPYIPNGRLLDIGCGAGNQLTLMRQLGWRVSGTDADQTAVDVARERGLDVRHGSVLQADWEIGEFDAITLVHVIEHLEDSRPHLRRCAELLKPGGRLVIVTPNADATGHRFFGRDWRGLEPPRHLQVYTMNSLRKTVETSGLVVTDCRTSARDAAYMLWFSEKVSLGKQSMPQELRAPAQHLLARKWRACEEGERVLAWLGRPVGEETVLIAQLRR